MRATYDPSSAEFTTSNTGDTEYKIINLMDTATAVAPDTATAGTPVTLIATVLQQALPPRPRTPRAATSSPATARPAGTP